MGDVVKRHSEALIFVGVLTGWLLDRDGIRSLAQVLSLVCSFRYAYGLITSHTLSKRVTFTVSRPIFCVTPGCSESEEVILSPTGASNARYSYEHLARGWFVPPDRGLPHATP